MNLAEAPKPPKLAKRRDHKNSSFRAGRTIGEKREKLETRSERAAARKKDKNKKAARIVSTMLGFLCLIGALIALFVFFAKNSQAPVDEVVESVDAPTIEIVDEDANSGGQITSRMREYIAQLEKDLKAYNLRATKAVIPSGSIREVRFYLDGYKGYIKTLIDRGTGVTAEDINRMLVYLKNIEVTDFEYIDVRIDQKAFWK